jgi:uncharacterized membrane protein
MEKISSLTFPKNIILGIKPVLFFLGGMIILGSIGQLSLNRADFMYGISHIGKIERITNTRAQAIFQDIQIKVYSSSIVLVLGVVLFIGSLFIEYPENDKIKSIREQEKLLRIINNRLTRGEISLDEYDEIKEKIKK